MKFGKLALAASAVSLAITPAAFAAERVSAPVEGESEIGGGNGVTIGIIFSILAIGLGIAVTSGNDDPVSP
ncbi:hypothetical protein A9995_11875 [Erythrobacter sp. QSSC1-22B]|uniref:hypothetical protein n=1 Tax=Erythrobacter sp. QSSC1-22B TaxID=1860125 RepID=UPI00080501B6|nr:hypothetical protein [Erythrobacter sp. QSSC1-22B]OBX18644.1 hypothetical protein A9995_11875 [Erythrobacter sp. QSSC1-22B]